MSFAIELTWYDGRLAVHLLIESRRRVWIHLVTLWALALVQFNSARLGLDWIGLPISTRWIALKVNLYGLSDFQVINPRSFTLSLRQAPYRPTYRSTAIDEDEEGDKSILLGSSPPPRLGVSELEISLFYLACSCMRFGLLEIIMSELVDKQQTC